MRETPRPWRPHWEYRVTPEAAAEPRNPGPSLDFDPSCVVACRDRKTLESAGYRAWPPQVKFVRGGAPIRKILAISVLSNAAVFGPVLGADCNKNGVDDIAEVRSGQSPDCNRNGVPDDCDLRPVNPGLDLSGEISTEGLYEPWEMRFADMDSDGDLDLLGTSHFSPVLLVMVEYCPHQDEQGEYKAE